MTKKKDKDQTNSKWDAFQLYTTKPGRYETANRILIYKLVDNIKEIPVEVMLRDALECLGFPNSFLLVSDELEIFRDTEGDELTWAYKILKTGYCSLLTTRQLHKLFRSIWNQANGKDDGYLKQLANRDLFAKTATWK